MLEPIPYNLLTDTATLNVVSGIDEYQVPTYDTYTVSHVHLQNTNEVRKTADNTEVVLRSLLFVDSKYSTPKLDWDALARQSEASGGQVRVIVGNNNYAVQTVDLVPDDQNNIHHVELGLV